MPATPLTVPAMPLRPAARPSHYEGLLTHPICDDPAVSGATCYSNWEFDHADKARFYVGGFLWFLRLRVAPDAKALFANYKDRALAEVTRIGWDAMPGSPAGAWTQLSQNQVYAAKDGTKQYFQKCALVILACELAAQDAINAGAAPAALNGRAETIHEHMSIIPAAWNVDRVRSWVYANPEVKKGLIFKITEQDHQTALARIDQTGSLAGGSAILDMADGHTVSFDTAKRLKDYLETAVGDIRSRPGRKFHGKKAASEHEVIERG